MRVTPPPPLLVAQSMASLGRPLASPLLWSISTFSHEIYHRGFVFSRRFNLTVVRVLFTLLPRLIDHFSTVGTPPGPPTLPAPVRGSGAGGGGGWGQQGRPPLRGFSPHFSQLVFLDVRRVSSHGRKTDPGVLLLFWGDFGGRAPTAVGDQSYLGPVYGEYLGYPSDPYRPHTLEQSPPSDFGPVYVFLVPFASPEDDFFR